MQTNMKPWSVGCGQEWPWLPDLSSQLELAMPLNQNAIAVSFNLQSGL